MLPDGKLDDRVGQDRREETKEQGKSQAQRSETQIPLDGCKGNIRVRCSNISQARVLPSDLKIIDT